MGRNEMRQIRGRNLAIGLVIALAVGVPAASKSAKADPPAGASVLLAQYYPYGPPPPRYYGGQPPCGSAFRGAARGAAGGAIIGGIAGDAGKGAAIGAGVGLLGRAVRNSNARANGYCY